MKTKICKDNKPLAAIVCGYERGGTTLVSTLLRQHPKLYSGFEGGFLLVDDVADFLELQPYCRYMEDTWGIENSDIRYICKAKSWSEVYRRLIERSPIFEDKEKLVFDKTPRYMRELENVLRKVPGVPCIVVVRDPRAVIWSWIKRNEPEADVRTFESTAWIKKNLKKYCTHYMTYANGWRKAVDKGYGSRILLIQYESLCKNQRFIAKEIFRFIGLSFDEAYLTFKSSSLFPNIHSADISVKYLTEYKDHLPEETCLEILNATKEYENWFWPR